MLQELMVVSMFGGLVALDKTEACQTMLSQPLFIGPVVGLLLHDLSSGLLLGILFQLAYLWVMPIGTATFPDSAVGTVVGSFGFVVLTDWFPDSPNLVLLLIFLFVIPFSLLAGWSLIKQRQLNSILLHKGDLYAEKANAKGFGYLFFLGLLGSFLRGFIITLLGLLICLVLLKPMIKLLILTPESYIPNMELPIWGLGIGTMIYLFGREKNLLWCMGGICLGIILLLF